MYYFDFLLGILLAACVMLQQSIFIVAKPYRSGFYMEPKCVDKETNRELFIGDAFTRPGQCIRVQCLGNLELWEDKCQIPPLQGDCKSTPTPNEFLDYPKCCPMYECKIYKLGEHGEVEEIRTYDHYGTLKKTHITQVFVVKDLQDGQIPGSGIKTQFQI